MLTIPNAVEEVIKKKPFLEGALVEGLVNLSALARQLKPEVEKKVGKEVNDSAVIMALNRLVPRLELLSAMKFKKVVENIGDIIVRSNLADYAFANSPTLYEKQAQLLERVRNVKDLFCTFSQGIYETTLVVSSSIAPLVDDIFRSETHIAKTTNLSSITVKLPIENTVCPGVYYYIFKELAWDNINILEVISTTTEFTVVVSDEDIHRAFTILMEAKRQAGS
jgi:hypothetical protein